MPLTIDVAFRKKYHDDLIMLAQQKESRLENTVRKDPDTMNAAMAFYDRLAAFEDEEDLNRFGDTPNILPDHSRRRIIFADYIWAGMIDRKDERRMANSAQMPDKYRRGAVMAMNRRKDTIIIAAASGDAFGVDAADAAAAIALPAAQKIAHGSAGLTLAKLLQTKEIIDGAEVDEEEEKTFVLTAKQVTNLLNTTEIKSADYNTIKALAEGRINDFLGFNFIRSERLLTNAGGNRLCLAYAKSGIGLAMGEEINSDIGRRRDKKNNIQVQVDYAGGATRIEDEKVVEIECTES